MLQGLEQYCGVPSFSKTVEYIETTRVLSFEHLVTKDNRQIGNISIDGDYHTMRFLPGKKLYKIAMKESSPGEYAQEKISGIITGYDVIVAGELKRMNNYRFINRYTDASGQKWILGTPDNPFRFRHTFDSNAAIITAEFYRETNYPAHGLT